MEGDGGSWGPIEEADEERAHGWCFYLGCSGPGWWGAHAAVLACAAEMLLTTPSLLGGWFLIRAGHGTWQRSGKALGRSGPRCCLWDYPWFSAFEVFPGSDIEVPATSGSGQCPRAVVGSISWRNCSVRQRCSLNHLWFCSILQLFSQDLA